MSGRRFKYVYVPADLTESIQERTLEIPEDKDVECLLDELKKHFARTGPRTAQTKEAHKQMLLQQMGDKAAMVNEKMLEAAANLDLVENISLLANSKDVGYVGVNMYCDDQAQIKGLPYNPRASGLAEVCGKFIQVRGDAFIARIFDNEDHFKRLDFELSEMNSSAEWVKLARQQAMQRDQSSAQHNAFITGLQNGSASRQPKAQVRELTPAEAAKEEGNAAFKAGKWEEAVAAYDRALETEPTMVVAANNKALALLKLGRHSEARSAADLVLKEEPRNVKALLRRATAQEALGQTEGAVADLVLVMEMEPNNKEAAAALDRLMPPPPPPAADGKSDAAAAAAADGKSDVAAVGSEQAMATA